MLTGWEQSTKALSVKKWKEKIRKIIFQFVHLILIKYFLSGKKLLYDISNIHICVYFPIFKSKYSFNFWNLFSNAILLPDFCDCSKNDIFKTLYCLWNVGNYPHSPSSQGKPFVISCIRTERRLQHPSVVIQHPRGRFFKHCIPTLKQGNLFFQIILIISYSKHQLNQTLTALQF